MGQIQYIEDNVAVLTTVIVISSLILLLCILPVDKDARKKKKINPIQVKKKIYCTKKCCKCCKKASVVSAAGVVRNLHQCRGNNQ